MDELWRPMLLSLRIALVATALTALVGVPLAFLLARRRFFGRSLVEATLLMPLVLPPTVVGYAIILLFGREGLAGRHLDRLFDYSLLFRPEGAVVAAAVVAFPLMYLSARAAFTAVEREFEDTARLLGARDGQVFWHVSLPMARRGIAAGLVLTFARALGEFGATVMVFGMQPDGVTLPVSIYAAYYQGDPEQAAAPALALSLIAVTVILLYNRSPAGRQA